MQRTNQQNRALHKGCDIIAQTLNAAGLDMRTVLKHEVEIPWTTASVKKYLFTSIMTAMTGKTSTTELEKQGEIEQVWETLMRFLMEKHHIEYIPFPSHELEYWNKAPMHEK